MTQDVELVVIARPQSVAYRPPDPNFPNAPMINLAVDEVLKGDPATLPDGSIQLYVDDDPGPSTIVQEAIPDVPTLLFVRLFSAGRPNWNLPDAEQTYYLPTTYQNVMVNLNGKVFLPMEARMRSWLGKVTWPLALRGASFDKVVSDVREAAGQAGSSDGVTARRSFAC